MGQRTLAFTRLLLRVVSYNTLRNLGLLIVYAKQTFIQHIWEMIKKQYTRHGQPSEHKVNNVNHLTIISVFLFILLLINKPLL
jgi:hypothetical protein